MTSPINAGKEHIEITRTSPDGLTTTTTQIFDTAAIEIFRQADENTSGDLERPEEIAKFDKLRAAHQERLNDISRALAETSAGTVREIAETDVVADTPETDSVAAERNNPSEPQLSEGTFAKIKDFIKNVVTDFLKTLLNGIKEILGQAGIELPAEEANADENASSAAANATGNGSAAANETEPSTNPEITIRLVNPGATDEESSASDVDEGAGAEGEASPGSSSENLTSLVADAGRAIQSAKNLDDATKAKNLALHAIMVARADLKEAKASGDEEKIKAAEDMYVLADRTVSSAVNKVKSFTPASSGNS